MLELWFVRHGQTDWNREQRLQGWTDIELNDAGVAEAKRLGYAVECVPFVHIYTSDLKRARQTAQHIQSHLCARLSVDVRLRERRFGALEGRVRGPAAVFESPTDVDAETDSAVLVRINSFLQDALHSHPTGRLLVVTHGGMIRLLLHQFGFSSVAPIPNTGVTCVLLGGASVRITAVNSVTHLAD